MGSFKLIITGDKNFSDYSLLKAKVRKLIRFKILFSNVCIVSDAKDGAGMLGERFAAEFGYEVAEFPNDWTYNEGIENDINRQMASFADACICFTNGGSITTNPQILLFKLLNLRTTVVAY